MLLLGRGGGLVLGSEGLLGEKGGREVNTIAVQAKGDDREDELEGSKRKVEIEHGRVVEYVEYRGSGMWGR